MIYAYTYTASRTQIIHLCSAKTLNVECVELATPEAVLAHIASSDAQEVCFTLWGLPRFPISKEHPKLKAHVRKLFK
ncbi:MAG TPA: hypothetical protein VEF04_20060 [Blastocatellia bacterium]|nr:hypothetical protein [Blastocatellia bacterium]